MRHILLLSLVARCLETIAVCMHMSHVCFYVCLGVCGNVCCVVAIVKDSVFLTLEC